MNKKHQPDFLTANYRLCTDTGIYKLEPTRVYFNKLPDKLKVEKTFMKWLIEQGANEVIKGKNFITGLIPIGVNCCYYGNKKELVKDTEKISLIIFQFSERDQLLTVYYFNRYYIDSRPSRIAFCKDFILSKS